MTFHWFLVKKNAYILRLFDDVQIFLSPEVKRGAIISNKHGMCELSDEFSNDLWLAILKN